jgi:hypothetical protein
MLNLQPATLYRSLNSRFLTIERLQQISQSLNHNFFIYFIQNTGTTEEQLLKLTSENKELSSKVAALQKKTSFSKRLSAFSKPVYE